MKTNRVRVNSLYIYSPNMLDKIDGRTSLKDGDVVHVVNLPGAPKANTMGHCYVAEPLTGKFIGMVHVNSLHTKKDYIEYLKRMIAVRESEMHDAR
jgi:hypothetical protein